MSTPLRVLSGLALVAAVALGGAALYERIPCDPRAPDIYLISIDTLRADATSPYHVERRTPHLQRLAEQGEVFERAVTPMPLTRPAHFSMFTGLYPREHGVINNVNRLPTRQLVLAEELKRNGYSTAAFVSARHIGQSSGAGQGFDVFSEPVGRVQRRAEVAVREASQYVATAPLEEPIFLWLHTFDPHMPYDPPARYRDHLDRQLVAKYPSMRWPIIDQIAADNHGAISKEILDYTIRLYQREVEYNDEWLGRFLDAINEHRDFNEALIILTSDHGECFENGIYFEHLGLFEGAIHVPFVVRWPRKRVVGRSKKLVSHLDIAPTIFKELGISSQMKVSGRAIQDLGDEPRRLLLEHPEGFDWRPRVVRMVGDDQVTHILAAQERLGLVTDDWKYLRTDGTVHELYAMTPSPDEERNLAEREPELVAELSRRLDEQLRAHVRQVLLPRPIDSDLRETLEALGYTH